LSDIDAKGGIAFGASDKKSAEQRHFSGAGFGAGLECTTHHLEG
jgi:hypothetical protein